MALPRMSQSAMSIPLSTETAAPDRPHHLDDSYIRFQSGPDWSGSLPIRCGM